MENEKRGMLPFRAAIVDFDRTLLRTDKTLSPRTLRALERWQAAGGRLFAATARPERAIGEYLAAAAFDGVTTLNGARTLTRNAIFENPVPRRSAEAVLAALCALPGAVVSVEAESGIYANADIPLWAPKVTEHLGDLPGREQIFKILASHPELPAEQLLPRLPEDVYSTVAEGKLLQVMSRAATKWNGVGKMLEAYGIPPEAAVFFGDDNDDLEPIRRCGRGVAVANALPAVRAAADEVTGSNDADGVAQYLEALLARAGFPARD